VLNHVNKLPQVEMLKGFAEKKPEIKESLSEASETIQDIIKSLLEFSWGLYHQNPEYLECYDGYWDGEKKRLEEDIQVAFKKKAKTTEEQKTKLQLVDKLESIGKKRKRIADFDAEDELNLETDPNKEEEEEEQKSDRKIQHWWKQMELLREAQEPFIDQIIDRWNRKTQLSSNIYQTKFKAINQNILTQVENAMLQREKLIQKTRLWRRGADDLPFGKKRKISQDDEGVDVNDDDDGKNNNNNKKKSETKSKAASLFSKVTVESIVAKERKRKDKSELEAPKDELLDEEIFDDSDFYQELLKELIEMEVSDDPHQGLALTRAWLKSKQRPKQHKDVDRRASKGRKIRYVVHEKLVNFMTPSEEPYPHFVDDLFANLFTN